MMSRLLKLKNWLTIKETASHLSIICSANISETDILRLALDGQLTLSLHLPKRTASKRAEMIPFPIELEYFRTKSEDDLIMSVKGDEIIYLDGVVDLPMIGEERLATEAEYYRVQTGKPFEFQVGGDIFVERDGQLFLLQQHFRGLNKIEYEVGDNEEEVLKKIALNNYCNETHLLKERMLIVRIDALREFEAKIEANETAPPSSVKTPGRREQQHEIILAIIAALDFDPQQIPDSGKAKIKSICLTRPNVFTDSGFVHAWKKGASAGLFKMANHGKFTSK